ncbi:MAG: toll/interleukin-1 receptor domain-containing protein [Isosphaeraceae bacterium]|nr:toll/interleukin-1 receptor domain-containing protein [Isosphaeraceae bacterium]
MKIFLSHRSPHKPLVREFRALLPGWLQTWVDEESLTWGDDLNTELKSTIASHVDFLMIFLDRDAMKSPWVANELTWALERERELGRTFVLPILVEAIASDQFPPGFENRLHLRLADFGHASVKDLADRAVLHLFKLVASSYAKARAEEKPKRNLQFELLELSPGQMKLVRIIRDAANRGTKLSQEEVERAFGAPSTEVYYRLECLVLQGYFTKEIGVHGRFYYGLTEEMRKSPDA